MLLWTSGYMYLFELIFSFPLDIYPWVEFLDHMISIGFKETFILFFIVTVPIYSLINSVHGVPFLHILANICSLLPFWWQSFWQVWGKISLLFWFSFLWWLAMVNLFVFACWPSVYLIWKSFRFPAHVLIENCIYIFVVGIELHDLFIYLKY